MHLISPIVNRGKALLHGSINHLCTSFCTAICTAFLRNALLSGLAAGGNLPCKSTTYGKIWWGELGAGDGNRTHVFSLEGCCSTIELHPRRFVVTWPIAKSECAFRGLGSPGSGGGGWIRTNVG